MAEPEDVIAEGALHATRLARELWARHTAGRTRVEPGLAELKPRLELFVAALFPAVPEIGTAEPPAPPSLLARIARRHSAHLHPTQAIASSDGGGIRLPARLESAPPGGAAARYRLLALEQAARVERGTHAALPRDDRLLQDLYLLSEAAAVDRSLVALLPRLAPVIVEERRRAAAGRPVMPRPSPRAMAAERLVLALLGAEPGAPPAPFGKAGTPGDSLEWAKGERAHLVKLAGPYHGTAPVPLWGVPTEAAAPASARPGLHEEVPTTPRRSRTLPRRPKGREAEEGEDDPEPGTWMIRADDLQEKAEDPHGLQRPADRDQDADPGELADALSELPEARLVRTPGPVAEVLAGTDPLVRVAALVGAVEPTGLAYPEWDWKVAGYRPRAAVVRERLAPAGSADWVASVLHRRASMIRAVRRDFERLRPRRRALRRQLDGAELDVDALVAAFADRRAAGLPDERCYIDTRPERRDTAIALLCDASASTDGWVAGDRRIIDVEKEALVIVGEALAALGDPHAILAFRSAGPARVDVQALKRFDEPAGSGPVRLRIAGLEPDGFTRAGAALRHATAVLGRRPARHRVLLLLSDGRPNDVDEYEGRYGIEDTRVAVAEARLQGIHVFCLTVDRQAPRYANRIFGRDFAVLAAAERLPGVLMGLLRDLMRG